VAAKFKVAFADLMTLNGWTLQENGIVPEWPGVGATIQIPAGATVPGVPPDPGVPTTTIAGAPAAPTTVAPATTVATTTTTEAPAEACGSYTIVDGDYPGLVATKLDTTVAKLSAANTTTKGYSSFYVGLVINVPC
jgi:LysM repeat protein